MAANEVSITNSPLEVTAPAGIRIPVVVENRPNEPVPVQVTNNPEIHGTVRLEPVPDIGIASPAFLAPGLRYDLHPIIPAVGTIPANPVHIHAVNFPWIHVQQVPRAGEPPPPPPVWVNTGLLLAILPR